jgi:hypothetical protein
MTTLLYPVGEYTRRSRRRASVARRREVPTRGRAVTRSRTGEQPGERQAAVRVRVGLRQGAARHRPRRGVGSERRIRAHDRLGLCDSFQQAERPQVRGHGLNLSRSSPRPRPICGSADCSASRGAGAVGAVVDLERHGVPARPGGPRRRPGRADQQRRVARGHVEIVVQPQGVVQRAARLPFVARASSCRLRRSCGVRLATVGGLS